MQLVEKADAREKERIRAEERKVRIRFPPLPPSLPPSLCSHIMFSILYIIIPAKKEGDIV